jgi:hypothetical protein
VVWRERSRCVAEPRTLSIVEALVCEPSPNTLEGCCRIAVRKRGRQASIVDLIE